MGTLNYFFSIFFVLVNVLVTKHATALTFHLKSKGLKSVLPQQCMHSRFYPSKRSSSSTSCLFSMNSVDEEDDDGWGDVEPLSNIDEARSSKEKELAVLRSKSSRSSGFSESKTSDPLASEPPERDLFIPIFALVSLIGLIGSYGYEMLRLYSRGELYVPWMNN